MKRDYEKLYKKWKVLAIIAMILFTLLLIFNIWAVAYTNHNLKKENICFYDICAKYPDAYYLDNICTCYDYDVIGNLVVSKSEYMKK